MRIKTIAKSDVGGAAMTVKRDFSGRLEAVRHVGRNTFFVTNRKPYKVQKYDANACMVTDACILPLWDQPTFGSWSQAVKWMYDNAHDLF